MNIAACSHINYRVQPWGNSTTGGGTLWTPAQFTAGQLEVWLDFTDTATITESGGQVSAVLDKSGNANNYSQGAGANQPITGTRTINGLNALDFDGAGDHLDGPVLALTSYSKYIVAERDANASNNLCSRVTGGNDTLYFGGGAFPILYHNANTITATDATVIGTPFFVSGQSTASGDANLYLNGKFQGFSASTMPSGGSITEAGAFIGANTFNGKIAEIIIVPFSNNATDRRLIEGYISHKYNIPINDVTHPYYSTPPYV